MEKVAIHMKKQRENFIKFMNILKKDRATNIQYGFDQQILRMSRKKIVRKI